MENLELIIDKLNAWNQQERYAEVLVEADSYLMSEKNESGLYVLKGNALFGLGRFNEALKAYEEAIKADTFDVQARVNYGSTLFTLGRYVDALNACDAAILTDETFAPAYINVAHCLTALHHQNEAVYALWQAYSLDKTDISLGRTAAAMASDLEEYEVARDIYLDLSVLPDMPSELPEEVYHFFLNARQNNLAERTQIFRDVEVWRQKCSHHPDVLKFSTELLRG